MKTTITPLFILFAILLLSTGFKRDSRSPEWVKKLQEKYQTEEEFIAYWYNSKAMKEYEYKKRIPQEVIIGKMWMETQGGHTGAGRRGALFGIKGKGVKGYDNVDEEKVEYQAYNEAWEALSHFCDLINNDPVLIASGQDKIDNNMYLRRYQAWSRIHPDYEPWEWWLLALQVHPQREKSAYAYAANGCSCNKKGKISKRCYEKRKKTATKTIDWIHEKLKPRK